MDSKDEFIDKLVYIDSNILMDEKFEGIVKDFLENEININIIMPKVQYDEIYNLRKNNDEAKAYRARQAFRVIEQLIDNKLININDLEDIDNKKAYADPEFLKIIIQNIQNNKIIIFLTEDMDLRIRLKNKINELELDSKMIDIYSLNDFPYYERMKEKQSQEELRKRKERYEERREKSDSQSSSEEEKSSSEEEKSSSEEEKSSAKDIIELVGIGILGAISVYSWFTS